MITSRRHMQVGDAPVAVDHVHRRARGCDGVDLGHDVGLTGDLVQKRTKPLVRVDAKRVEPVAELVEDGRQPGADSVSEMIGSETFIIVAFM